MPEVGLAPPGPQPGPWDGGTLRAGGEGGLRGVGPDGALQVRGEVRAAAPSQPARRRAGPAHGGPSSPFGELSLVPPRLARRQRSLETPEMQTVPPPEVGW